MQKALEGIRVLDLSRLLPGPYCSMMLANLGAEVIKVEDTKIGDPTRWSKPRVGDESARFIQANTGKKSIALDLKTGEARQLFLKLAETADVVLDQFRPGVVDRLGIGYEAVSRVNRRIVYCSLTGYGQNGPYRDRAGHDINYIALAGALGLTSDATGCPAIPGVQIADLAGGILAGFAILAALIAREKTGSGQLVDVSMFDVVVALLTVPAATQFSGIEIGVGGKYVLTGAYPYYNVYETADGRFMSLGALEPKFWENFCRRIGREDLIARQFDDGDGRQTLFDEVRGIFKARSRDDWVELMREADACCEPVLSMAEAFAHAQAQARGMVVQSETRAGTAISQLGPAYKLSGTPASVTGRAPLLGEHTDELLAEIGVTSLEREQLSKQGVIKRA